MEFKTMTQKNFGHFVKTSRVTRFSAFLLTAGFAINSHSASGDAYMAMNSYSISLGSFPGTYNGDTCGGGYGPMATLNYSLTNNSGVKYFLMQQLTKDSISNASVNFGFAGSPTYYGTSSVPNTSSQTQITSNVTDTTQNYTVTNPKMRFMVIFVEEPDQSTTFNSNDFLKNPDASTATPSWNNRSLKFSYSVVEQQFSSFSGAMYIAYCSD